MRTTARDRGDWTRTITGRVSSSGGVYVSSEPIVVTRSGTGQYTVRVLNPCKRILGQMANSEAATFILATVAATDNAGAITVSTWNSSSGAPADAQFSFSMTVSDR